MAFPLVSIVIPTIGRPELADTLASLDAQSFRDFETVLVDDTDKTLGPGGARHAGICRSRGRYIAFLDDDDLWDRNYLERALDVLKFSGAGMVHCDARILDGDTWPLGRKTFNAQQAQLHQQEVQTGLRSLRQVFLCPTLGMGVIVTRLASTGYPMHARLLEDYEFQLHVALRGHRIYYIHEPLGTYRLHRGNQSHAGIEAASRMVEIVEDYASSLRNDGPVRRRRAQAYMDLSAAEARHREYVSATGDFWRALGHAPRYAMARATEKALDWMFS